MQASHAQLTLLLVLWLFDKEAILTVTEHAGPWVEPFTLISIKDENMSETRSGFENVPFGHRLESG